MKQSTIIVLVAGVIITILTMGFLSRDTKGNKVPAEATHAFETRQTAPGSAGESDLYKDAYMEGCLFEPGAAYMYCSCTYDHIVDNYGVDGLLDMVDEFESTGSLPASAQEAVKDCLHWLPSQS